MIQGVYSLNPTPTNANFISESAEKGFVTINNEKDLEKICKALLLNERHYFSSMMSKKELGKIVATAAKEKDDEKKGETFLRLLKGSI